MSDIELRHIFAPHLRGRAQEAIEDGTLDVNRFNDCFTVYPDVLVSILRLSGLDQPVGHIEQSERDYMLGGTDLARDIWALSTMRKEDKENDDV